MKILKRIWALPLALGFIFACAGALTAQEGEQANSAPLPTSMVPVDKLDQDWWKDRFEAQKARIAEGNVDLLLLGDSITHYWDTTGRAVEEYYYGDRNFANLGIGSDRTQHLLWRLDNLPMENIHPKAAMLLIGVNNSFENSAEEVARAIRAIVDKLTGLYPDMPILLLKIFPAGEKPDHPTRLRVAAINALLPDMFNDYPNVTLMDIGHLWVDENGVIPKDLMPDFGHPNEEGYKRWGAEVEPVLSRMLGDTPKEKMP